MFQQKVSVHYRDGHQETVTTSQADVAAWELWATRRGLRPTAPDRSLMQDLPVTFLRFAAWNAVHRDGSPRAEFETWSDTVDEVSVEEQETPDPTPATIPAT